MKTIQMNKTFRKMLIKIIPYIFIIWFISGVPDSGISQQIDHDVICSGGETLMNTNFSLEYTIGEIAVESLISSGYMLTQGFLQGTLNGIGFNEQLMDPDKINIYPNPAIDHLYLNCQTESEPISIELRDIRGQLILSMQYLSDPTLLSINQLNSGFYTLTFRFTDYQPIIKKIIKK